MDLMQFKQLKEKYRSVDTDEKVGIYTNTEGLTQTQYSELLALFPLNELNKLEQALQ